MRSANTADWRYDTGSERQTQASCFTCELAKDEKIRLRAIAKCLVVHNERLRITERVTVKELRPTPLSGRLMCA